MTKRELQKIISEGGLKWQQAAEVADAIVNAMRAALLSGESVEFRGFGSLRVKAVKPRRARKINSEELFTIPARNVVRFHAHPEFTSKLNK